MTLKELLNSKQGKFFTVVFTKKNGDDRLLNGRLGVTKHLKGGKKTVNQDNYLTVFCTKKQAYRTVNINTVKLIKLGGKEYQVIDGNIFEKVGTRV
jgi:hypothetical protein